MMCLSLPTALFVWDLSAFSYDTSGLYSILYLKTYENQMHHSRGTEDSKTLSDKTVFCEYLCMEIRFLEVIYILPK